MTELREQLLKSVGVKKSEQELHFCDWDAISRIYYLTDEFIREFQDKVSWSNLSEHQKLSESIMREFEDKIIWGYISMAQSLSEEFIREFQHLLNWNRVSICQTLSDKFLIEFKDKIQWDSYFLSQTASYNIMKRFLLRAKINDFNTVNKDLLTEKQINEFEKIFKFKRLFMPEK